MHLDLWRQREPPNRRQPVEEEGPWDVGWRCWGGAFPETRGLDELLEEQAEEMVQPGSVVHLTERAAGDTIGLEVGHL